MFYMKFVDLYNHVLENPETIHEIKRQYLELLGELTISPDISEELFLENIQKINNMGKIMIGIEEKTMICTGTIIIEPKLIRGGKSVGHIEDIVVKKDYRGQGIAHNLLNVLKEIGKNNDTYKIILDCDENLETFYGKSEFKKNGTQMSKYF